jgi:hypothetical protein
MREIKKKRFIGHYGCDVADRLVRIRTFRENKPINETTNVDPCPACGGYHHGIKPMWRRPAPGEYKRAEYSVR